jgi:hypothetical protein
MFKDPKQSVLTPAEEQLVAELAAKLAELPDITFDAESMTIGLQLVIKLKAGE